MSDHQQLLDEALDAWRDAREGFIAEVENIPAKHFEFRPAEGVRSIRELCVHILEVAMMMVGVLTERDADFTRGGWAKLLEQHAGRAYAATTRDDLLSLLRDQLAEGESAFRKLGDGMFGPVKQFDGSMATRFSWFHHGIAQEMYHRGQMTVYARLLGVTPALTKRIRGE